MKFKVSAILPIPAEVYFIERDSSAFRSLVAEVSFCIEGIALARRKSYKGQCSDLFTSAAKSADQGTHASQSSWAVVLLIANMNGVYLQLLEP